MITSPTRRLRPNLVSRALRPPILQPVFYGKHIRKSTVAHKCRNRIQAGSKRWWTDSAGGGQNGATSKPLT